MTDFFRFPHTPHIAWLATGEPRHDKVLSPEEAKALLAEEVVLEEKLDGANLGLSLAPDGSLRAQNRGQYLCEPYTGQFSRLPGWLAQHSEAISSSLKPTLMLFGEWCAARHSLDYSDLPDWFLLFDVYDRQVNKFWSSARRNALAENIGLSTVPELERCHQTLPLLKARLQYDHSRFRSGPLEGIIIRQDSNGWCKSRAKLVREDFTQTISEHWRRHQIEWNQLSKEGEHLG
ncbi:RNA ligase family protein [Chromobacterium vaccinii]|uniref:RNA ligase family protein n=1 Tax=Chromobacterium vaccinii TaxID=1108595 RepID=UPI0009F38768|nr:RNA ligase family protein [Chromobacterium vaccinii]